MRLEITGLALSLALSGAEAEAEGLGLAVGAGLPAIPPGTRYQRGMGYIELIISIIVIAVAVSGVLLVINQNAGHSADPLIERQALAIAESYLEEIRLKRYLDPDTATVCPAPEANRADYDNVCDYAGLNDSDARDQTGAAISGLSAYGVQVTVDQTATLHNLSGSTAVLRVTVQVTHDSGPSLSLAAYRTNY